jgi:hypothetical protein
MKTLLIYAASLIFISGTALAREVILTPSVPFHGASAPAEHRDARLESPVREGAVFCSAMYVTTIRGDGSSATRQICELRRIASGPYRGAARSRAAPQQACGP